MKATFALLASRDVHNWVRQLAWDIHQKYHTGTIDNRLPPHISLKQPFVIQNFTALDEYMLTLAQSITPFPVTLTELQLVPILFQGTEFGLLWLNVQKTKPLRQLHNRLNQELANRFANTQAEHDGEAYHFHMTVMMGGQPIDVYRKIYNEFGALTPTLQFQVRELAMFVYDEPLQPHGEYLTYKILPMGE